MNILQQSFSLVSQKFAPHVGLQQRYLFQFAITAFILSPRFESLNSNARLVTEKSNTAHSKLYRLLRNTTLLNSFSAMTAGLRLLTAESVVVIDFSTFCGFQVLTFALQTHKGRAIPLFFDCLTYPILEAGSQNIFIIETIRRFIKVFGVTPRFVLDRGFAIPSLIKFFVKNDVIFYVRCKQKKLITIPDGVGGEYTVGANCLKHIRDTTMRAYGNLSLRLITSEFDPKNHKEPWYIITNDFNTGRKDIIEIYYFRFEIEEAFKDLKHLFGLKKFFIKRMMSFKVLLWCFILKVLLAFHLSEKLNTLNEHAKKRLSFIRRFNETFQRQIIFSHLTPLMVRRF